jgi:hypothetical protein
MQNTDIITNLTIQQCQDTLSTSSLIDSIAQNHWYNFYNNAFSHLIACHAALFCALITITCAIFALKYWHEKKDFDKTFSKKLSSKIQKAENKLRKHIKEQNFEMYITIKKDYIDNLLNTKPHTQTSANSIIEHLQDLIICSKESKPHQKQFFIDFSELWSKILDQLTNTKNIQTKKEECQNIINFLKNFSTSDEEIHLIKFQDKVTQFENLINGSYTNETKEL